MRMSLRVLTEQIENAAVMAEIAKKLQPEEKCSRCGVSVPVHLIDLPNRCLTKDCPLNKESNAS